MLAPIPTLLLALALFVGAPALAQPRIASCEGGPRRIELKSELTDEVPELCIGAGLSTIISFEGAELQPEGVSLEGRERFTRVEVSATVLRLVPSEQVAPGERFKLTVRFKDGAAPASAVFWLGVYPGQLEPLVEVYRQRRTVESCQQELKEKQAHLRQCREDNARLLAGNTGPRGLAGLIATRRLDLTGVIASNIQKSVRPHPDNALRVVEVISYRSTGTVAIELKLYMTEAVLSWSAVEAQLTEPGRRMLRKPSLWQEPSSGSDARVVRIVVELEATKAETRGSFTLKVTSEDGTRSIVLAGVTFP